MSRFDVYRNHSGSGYLLDVQSDLLEGLNTRVVVSFLPVEQAPLPARRLNPVFDIDNTRVVMTPACVPACTHNGSA